MYNLNLRPYYVASVSGGKDSLYMLNLILNNLDKYPLNCVVNFDLEIDWEWSKNVVKYIENKCVLNHIPFKRFSPDTSFFDLLVRYDMPTNKVRWCNGMYKLDCKKKMYEWVNSFNFRVVQYIGLCADETKRFKYKIGSDWKLTDTCYPLAEENILESTILSWAKNVSIFNDWYKYFTRQGCMFCPLLSMKEKAYLFKFYPDVYFSYMYFVEEWEKKYHKNFFGEDLVKHKNKIENKWFSILNDEINFPQISFNF